MVKYQDQEVALPPTTPGKLRVFVYSAAFLPKIDGVSLRTSHLVRILKKMGYDILVLCPYDKAPDFYEGVPILKLPAFQPLDYAESKLAYPFPIITLLKIFSQFRPDIVHFIGPEFVFYPILMVCRMFGVPLIGSYHFHVQAWLETQPILNRLFLSWILYFERIYSYSDYVITPSQPMKEILNARGMKCNDVWPPAVDSEKFNPRNHDMEMRNLLTFGHPENPLIVYIGRISGEKGLEALEDIPKRFPNAYLALIGGGARADYWKSLHGDQSHIFCLGEHWSNEKLTKAYASADIFVLPSRFETLGNVILEAMASGTSVVGCNAGGVPHMIKHRVNGLLFEPNDKDGLLNAIGELLENKPFREQLIQEGLKYSQSINWENSSAYVAQIYERVVRMKAEGKYANMTDVMPLDPKKTSLTNSFIQTLCFLFMAAMVARYVLDSL